MSAPAVETTAADVADWIAIALRPASARNPGERAALTWPALYLPPHHRWTSEAREYVLQQARCRADGESWREYCRDRWPSRARSQIEVRRRWALEQIAAALDREAMPPDQAATTPSPQGLLTSGPSRAEWKRRLNTKNDSQGVTCPVVSTRVPRSAA